jgi:hypothetical protein
MFEVTTLDGQVVAVDENSIVLVVGPYPNDVGPHTYVYGATPGAIVTAEKPEILVGRLKVKPGLAQLTRPNGTPGWLKGAAVTSIRAPVSSEITTPGAVNGIVNIGPLHQAVRESVETARQIINAHGGHL